jgi:hypothetical protein
MMTRILIPLDGSNVTVVSYAYLRAPQASVELAAVVDLGHYSLPLKSRLFDNLTKQESAEKKYLERIAGTYW